MHETQNDGDSLADAAGWCFFGLAIARPFAHDAEGKRCHKLTEKNR